MRGVDCVRIGLVTHEYGVSGRIIKGNHFPTAGVSSCVRKRGYLSPATIRRSTRCCQLLIKEKFICISWFLRHLCTHSRGGSGKSSRQVMTDVMEKGNELKNNNLLLRCRGKFRTVELSGENNSRLRVCTAAIQDLLSCRGE